MEIVSKCIESLPRIEREMVVSIAAATALLYTSYKLVTSTPKAIIKPGTKEIPEPGSSLPYVGHMFSLGSTPNETLREWHKKHGPIIKLKMGVRTWILIDEPELAHKVLATRGAETAYRPLMTYGYYYHSLGGKGLVLSEYGPFYKKNRSAALAVLAPNLIAAKYSESIRFQSQALVDRLMEATESDGGVEPYKNLEMNSLNVLFLACFGRTFRTIDDPEFMRLSAIIEETIQMSQIENDLGNFLPIFRVYEYLVGIQGKMRRLIDNKRDPMFKQLMKEAAEADGPNVVKSLIENGVDFDETEMLVFMADLVIAGTDTISVTLHWMFAVMCNYPEAQKRVFHEIDAFIKINGRIPDFKDRDQLPFCTSVIKECMRFRPISPFGVPRNVKEDLEVDGYVIPKDSTIAVSMLSIHRHESFYSEPDSFIPERFMDNQKTMQAAANGKLSGRDHFIFGFGRRICPGISLAECEIFSAFIQVFSRSTIEPVTEMPDISKYRPDGIVFTILPYKVKFVKRREVDM